MSAPRYSLEGFCVIKDIDQPTLGFFSHNGRFVADNTLTKGLSHRIPAFLNKFYYTDDPGDFVIGSIEKNNNRERRHQNGNGYVVVFTEQALKQQYVNIRDPEAVLDIHRKNKIRTPYKAVEKLIAINKYDEYKRYCPLLIPTKNSPKEFDIVNLFFQLPAHVRCNNIFTYMLLRLERYCIKENLRRNTDIFSLEPVSFNNDKSVKSLMSRR